MYRQQVAKKTSPTLPSTPRSKPIAPTRSYDSLSSVVQRAQQDPKTVSGDEWKQLDSAIGTRATQEILAGKKTPWVPKFKGISEQLWGDSGQKNESIQAKAKEAVEDRVPPFQFEGISEQLWGDYPQERELVDDYVIQKKGEKTDSPAITPAMQRPNQTGLPDNLKAGIENLSGYSMDDVKVHYNSSRPAQLGALAYTQGTEIHVGPGQERHLAHEAWHVVQQKEGRVKPTIQAKGMAINDDKSLERQADLMGALAEREGKNNFFRQEEYYSGRRDGQELIAQELTHVEQHNGGTESHHRRCKGRIQEHQEILPQKSVAGVGNIRTEKKLVNHEGVENPVQLFPKPAGTSRYADCWRNIT